MAETARQRFQQMLAESNLTPEERMQLFEKENAPVPQSAEQAAVGQEMTEIQRENNERIQQYIAQREQQQSRTPTRLEQLLRKQGTRT